MGSSSYEYNAKLVRVVDGDTFDVSVDLGFKIYYTIRVRLADYDTPELNSKNDNERKHAREAKEFCEAIMSVGELCIRTRKDKIGIYGRYTADVLVVTPNWERSLGRLLEEKNLLKRSNYG